MCFKINNWQLTNCYNALKFVLTYLLSLIEDDEGNMKQLYYNIVGLFDRKTTIRQQLEGKNKQVFT